VAALGTHSVSGLVTNSRLVQAGVRGFVAIPPTTRAALRVLGRVSVYALIADWAVRMNFERLKVRDVARTLAVLIQLQTSVQRAWDAGAGRYGLLDAHYALLEDSYTSFINRRQFFEENCQACKQLTQWCEEYRKHLTPFLEDTKRWVVGVNNLAGKIETELAILLKP